MSFSLHSLKSPCWSSRRRRRRGVIFCKGKTKMEHYCKTIWLNDGRTSKQKKCAPALSVGAKEGTSNLCTIWPFGVCYFRFQPENRWHAEHASFEEKFMLCLVRSVYLAQLHGRLGKFLILVHSGQAGENFAYWAQLPFWNQHKPLRKPLTLLRTTVPLTELGKRFIWSWVTDSSEQFDFVVPEGPGECSSSSYKRYYIHHILTSTKTR